MEQETVFRVNHSKAFPLFNHLEPFLDLKKSKNAFSSPQKCTLFLFFVFKVAARVILFPIGCASGFFFQLTKHFTSKQSCFLERTIMEGSGLKATFFVEIEQEVHFTHIYACIFPKLYFYKQG